MVPWVTFDGLPIGVWQHPRFRCTLASGTYQKIASTFGRGAAILAVLVVVGLIVARVVRERRRERAEEAADPLDELDELEEPLGR